MKDSILQFIPVKIHTLTPPQDDLCAAITRARIKLKEKDIVLVTSKVVSIHEGRTVKKSDVSNKHALIMREVEYHLDPSVRRMGRSPLTIKHHAIVSAAGIDESNANNHYILLPENPYRSARELRTFLTKTYGLTHLGVIVTDSHSTPLRRGAFSISIGISGFHPVRFHKGRKDLFGRTLKVSATNLADSLAAGASAVCGEANEGTPIVIARGVPKVRFTDHDIRKEFLIEPEDDLYYPLLKEFYR